MNNTWPTSTVSIFVVKKGDAWARRHPISLKFGELFTITPDLIELWKQGEIDFYNAVSSLAREHKFRLTSKAADER